jgi:rRNA-processing protein FCF1
MTKIILDTNFIIACAKQKIDFLEELMFMGLKPIIPDKVLNELKRLKNKDAETALKILYSGGFEKIEIKGKYADSAIVAYLKKNKDVAIATLDKDLAEKISNKRVIIRGKKKLEII